MSEAAPMTGPRPRPRRAGLSAVLLRQLPGDNPIRRLWAGTKLMAAALVTVVGTIHPTWGVLVGISGLLLVTVVAARVSPRRLPRVSRWLVVVVLVGYGLGALGGDPGAYALLTLLAVEVLILSLLLIWTTPFDELGPTSAVLGAPLRLLRLPVDEWSTTIGLSVRSTPLVLDEARVLIAARRLRPRPARRGLGPLLVTAVDMLTALLTAAIRRATELGEAITARGGPAPLHVRRPRLTWRDGTALMLAVAATIIPWAIGY